MAKSKLKEFISYFTKIKENKKSLEEFSALKEDYKKLKNSSLSIRKELQIVRKKCLSLERELLENQGVTKIGKHYISMHAFRFLERFKGKNIDKILGEIKKELKNNPGHFVIHQNGLVVTYIGKTNKKDYS